MKNKMLLAKALTISGMMLFGSQAYAENSLLFSGDPNVNTKGSSTLSPVEPDNVSTTDHDDFYIKPQPIKTAKSDPKGFAQGVAKSIIKETPHPDYLALLDNEMMRLQSLPDDPNYAKTKLPVLKAGMSGDNVQSLVNALSYNGFMADNTIKTNYDEEVISAVKDAQKSFGIAVDGVAGPQLYRQLFVDKKTKIAEIKSWEEQVETAISTAQSENKPYVVIVNIPSFTLHVLDTNTKEELLESRVVVGRKTSQTPLGRANIISLKYNPDWTPPISFIRKKVLPSMTIPKGLILVDSHGNQITDMSGITKEDLLSGRYTLKQPAGEYNSLGILKFDTDSPVSIYLHDTDDRYLFARSYRAYSMGCVRVQQWPALAALLNHSDKNLIYSNINKGKTYIQRIQSIPVFYDYSLVDNVNGKVGYYADVYNKIK